MRRRALSKRISIFGLATISLALSGVAVGWHYGWLETLQSFVTGQFALDKSSAELSSDSFSDDLLGEGENTVEIDPIIFSGQSEPNPTDAGTFAGQFPSSAANRSNTGFSTKQWEEPTAPTIPQSFPTVRANGQSATEPHLPSQPNRGGIVPVGGIKDSESTATTAALDDADGTTKATTELPQARDDAESRFLNVDLKAIDRLIEAGEEISAHRELSKMYWNQPELRPTIQTRIERLAKRIYFSPQPHYMDPYVIQPGDQLRVIAKQYSITWEYLSKLNDVDPRRIQAGQKLKVIKGPFSAIVDLSDFELTVHAHGYYVRRYQVGIGKDGRSPVGRFTVLNKVINPQYTDPEGRVIDSDDPQNPLGERWIDIGDSFGIHGTIDPESIGKAESRGCIRMTNDDVAEVYDLLTLGSEIIIRR